MTDMLFLKPGDAKEDGIHVQVSKTRNSLAGSKYSRGSMSMATTREGERPGMRASPPGRWTSPPGYSAQMRGTATSMRKPGGLRTSTRSGSVSWTGS
jgi:hypothetical protein